jgi:hypothetical protein
MKKIIIGLLCFLASMAIILPAVADQNHDWGAGYRGYNEHPFDQNRQYARHNWEGHEYNYRGHWRSWQDWDDYARAHPYIHRHGRYYHEDQHLMFRGCDGNQCFFFSIGR